MNYGIEIPAVMQSMSSQNGGSEGGNSTIQWPPPPAHTFLFNGRTTISPPKPDTPPTTVSIFKKLPRHYFCFNFYESHQKMVSKIYSMI